MRRFIAVDGESFNIDGEHRYVLMASSTGDTVYNPRGLDTRQCFDFLLSQRAGYTLVAFGWNYDVNMMLKDVDARSLLLLWHNHSVKWDGYRIEWVTGKYFTVSRGRFRARVNDTFGFFQTSFVRALEDWGFDAEPEIARMKGLRGDFHPSMLPEIKRYCVSECKLMVRLMTRLQLALVNVELKPTQWVGAGSIGSALLRRHGVHNHRVPDAEFPTGAQDAIMRAYFGGRNELWRQGNFPIIHDYDISSAYPSEALKLPSLTDGKWARLRRYNPELPFALWRCSWNLPPTTILCPFPYRWKRGIMYPYNGRGWYHAAEVAAAKRIYGDAIVVDAGWSFTPGDNTVRPFDFIREIYDQRARLKATGHAGQIVLKLGMNSIYGKLAQGLQFRRPNRAERTPPFQSFLWAGMITAGTRARILDLAAMAPDALVMVATDGIFFTDQIDVPTEGGLGGLEYGPMKRAFVAQPGIYSYWDGEERHTWRRGFFSGEIDFDALERGFAAENVHHIARYESNRFCGLGYAMTARDMSVWRTWKEGERKLSLFPSTKWPLGYDPDAPPPTDNPIRHYAPPSTADDSAPYRVKQSAHLTDAEAAEKIVYLSGIEQPLRTTI